MKISAIDILLAPIFDSDGEAQHIDISMTWDTSVKQEGDVLLQHLLNRSGVPTAQYTQSAVEVRRNENQAPIELYMEDKGLRLFHLKKDVSAGKLVAKYRASPRYVDEFTKCGPQIAVEKEDSGISGAGMSFILRPPGDEMFNITIDWDLSSTPPDTQAVCTFGEGKVTYRGKVAVLDKCFFMVGAVKSYPTNLANNAYGLYWLDEPTFDAVAIGKQLEVVVPQTMAFFHDKSPLFLIFIRRNTQKCSSGRGCYRGFVFACNRIVPRVNDGISEFLFHEIVHNWPLLGRYTGGPEDFADGWFNEGIAEYYSLILPFRFDIFSEKGFAERINGRLSNYYTNPDRAILNKDVPDKFWQSGHVNRIPYHRGFMYFLRLAHQLHQAGKRSLDDLMHEMVRLRLAGEAHHIKTWLSLVEAELGPTALQDYRDMSDAKLIVPPSDCLNTFLSDSEITWKLQREDQEEFYLGFLEACLTTSPRVVRDLDLESRAAQAGVREGDQVTQKYSYFFDVENWEKKFCMTVKRESGDLEELSWWPRAWKKVQSYRFVAE